jgi:hypothetical protein
VSCNCSMSPSHAFSRAVAIRAQVGLDHGKPVGLRGVDTDLHARIETAREQEWLGDVEQLQLTLKHLHDKQDQVLRLLEIMRSPPLITTAPALSTASGLASGEK